MDSRIEPTIIEHEPFQIVGVYCTFEGDNEENAWREAEKVFFERYQEIKNRKDSLILGFLYRPHKDHPEISEEVLACFLGVDVRDIDSIPEGMSVTHYSGGKYALIACRDGGPGAPGIGVGEAIQYLHDHWMPEHGYRMGDACFTAGDEKEVTPPHTEYVHMKLEPVAG